MNIDFVKAEFNMETGLTAVRVSKLGINVFMIEADDGNKYIYRA